MKGTLTKEKIKAGHTSGVGSGHSQRGIIYRLINFDTDNPVEQVPLENLNEIKTGDMLLVQGTGFHDYLKTSPIMEIIDVTEDKIVVETQTSEYILTVNNDDRQDS